MTQEVNHKHHSPNAAFVGSVALSDIYPILILPKFICFFNTLSTKLSTLCSSIFSSGLFIASNKVTIFQFALYNAPGVGRPENRWWEFCFKITTKEGFKTELLYKLFEILQRWRSSVTCYSCPGCAQIDPCNCFLCVNTARSVLTPSFRELTFRFKLRTMY